MFRQFFLINIFLLLATLVVGWVVYERWRTPFDMPDVGADLAVENNRKIKVNAPIAHGNPNSPEYYETISREDLFRPQRKPYIPPKKKSDKPTPTPTPKGTPVPTPKAKVTAILKLGRKRVALITDPSIEKGEPQAYARGDELLEYTIAQITSRGVVLAKEGAEPIPLSLRDYKTMFAEEAPPPTAAGRQRGQPRGRTVTRQPPQRKPQTPPQQTPVNPFPFLKEAMEKAQREMQERGIDEIPEPPPLPPFLQGLGAD
jgi:hypothetical protein